VGCHLVSDTRSGGGNGRQNERGNRGRGKRMSTREARGSDIQYTTRSWQEGNNTTPYNDER